MARYEADADAPCSRPLEYLLRSLVRLKEERFTEAQADARRGRGAGRERVAGHLLFAAGAYAEGLELLEESGAETLRVRLAQKLGWTLDVLAAVESSRRTSAQSHRHAQLAGHLYAQGGDARRALQIASDALKASPGDVGLTLLFATVVPPERHREARARLEALPLQSGEAGLRLGRALRALGGDPYPQLETSAGSRDVAVADQARAELAQIAFEDGDDASAREWCGRVRDFEGVGRQAQAVLGALAMEGGDEEGAERIFLRASKDIASPFLLFWWAELYLRQGRFDEAQGVLHRSRRASSGVMAAPFALQRLLLAASTAEQGRRLGGHRLREVEPVLRRYGEPSRVLEVLSAPSAKAVATLTRAVLNRISRRRTSSPFAFTGARSGLRRAMERIRVLGDAALGAFDTDVRAHGWGGALVRAHRGVLLTWLGREEEAAAELQAAIDEDPRTHLAYAGLSALALQRGDAGEALRFHDEATLALGAAAGSVHVLRGEALRLMGRHAEAKDELLRALQLHPARISASLNLALLACATGDGALMASMRRRVCAQAPGLVSDARRQAKVDQGRAAETDEETFREALKMLGANRSSTCMSYVAETPRGPRRRFVQRPDAGLPTQTSIAEDEYGRLRSVLGLDAPRVSASAGVRGPANDVLEDDAATVRSQHFARHGYCVLRGAFSREVAEAWVRSATERICAQPDLFVKGYAPKSPPLWEFDANDPSSWTWARIELMAKRRMSFEAFSPKLWAMLRRIAGPSLEAEQLSDYLVLNLCENNVGPRDDGRVPQASGTHGWHVDDPSASMSLDTLRNGLVLVMLFSDCAEGEGGTLLLNGSDAVVARHLREHPEGVDLSDISTVGALSAGLADVTQVHGEAGDVYICSSLLLHTSAPNPSGRIRWMANPMLHLSEPPRLSVDSNECTPLEASIRRALGA